MIPTNKISHKENEQTPHKKRGPQPGESSISMEKIEIAIQGFRDDLSYRTVAAKLRIANKTIYDWRTRGKATLEKLESKEVKENDLSEYESLCYIFYTRMREAKAELLEERTRQFTKLGETTEVDHVKEKILYKSLVANDREKWGDRPQIQINQQFNAAAVSDSVMLEAVIAGKIVTAVKSALPGGTVEERRLLADRVRGEINISELTDDADFSVDADGN